MNNTSVTTCGGNFYDSGGINGNYSNNSSLTKTFTPSIAGNYLQFTFTAFSLEDTYDFLYIYDGTSTAAPLIATFTGTTLPGTIYATNPSGALTFKFTSDSSTKDTGWAASISCAPMPNCPKPISLAVSNEQRTSVTLNWTGAASTNSWQVIAVPCSLGAPSPTASGTPVTSSPYVLTGLTEGTCYNFI